MGMRLSAIKAKTRTATVEFLDEKIDVSYFPAVVTPDLMDQVQKAADDDDLGVVGMLLSEVIDWWDVLDDNDKRLPPTPENIGAMPIPFLMAVMNEVQEDQRPAETKGTGPVDRHRR